MKRRTFWNLLLILFVISFFVTPLGYESKILLQRIFASSVDIIPENQARTIDFDWQLKDREARSLLLCISFHRGEVSVLPTYMP